jgi:CRP-like cAMP-binding protein
VLFEKGAPADHAYLLAHGAIEILQPGADGMSVVVKILQAPTLFGAIEAFGEEPLYLETVRCLGKVRVVRMTSARLRQVALDNPRAGYEALLDVARAFCVAARLEPARLAQTDTLLANALLAYVDVVGEERDGARFMTVKRTQSDLAAAIGAGERSVNRILSAWLDAGVVVKRDARYGVVDRAFLENLAGDLLGSLVHGSAHLL